MVAAITYVIITTNQEWTLHYEHLNVTDDIMGQMQCLIKERI